MDGSKSVLLVEDDPNISDIYRKALKKAGIKVHHAQNGNDALDQFLKHQPELVLLDVMIPEKTGIEVLRILRTEKKYNAKETVIIILSNVSAQIGRAHV